MKVVIDIPDRIYKINQNRRLNITDAEILEKAVRNGTPLPKGHGRLIDADMLKEWARVVEDTELGRLHTVDVTDINNASTIIEADKEMQE